MNINILLLLFFFWGGGGGGTEFLDIWGGHHKTVLVLAVISAFKGREREYFWGVLKFYFRDMPDFFFFWGGGGGGLGWVGMSLTVVSMLGPSLRIK